MAKTNDAKEQLIDASDRLFSESGYDNVSVDDICRSAGKAKGLFFYYFEKKENVVKIIARRQVKTMSETITRLLEKRAMSSVERMDFMMNLLLSNKSLGPGVLYYFKDKRVPDWLDAEMHQIKDEYIFPIIRDIVHDIVKEKKGLHDSSMVTEIVYLGISAFMHKNYTEMEKTAYYKPAIEAITHVLETVMDLDSGMLNIQ